MKTYKHHSDLRGLSRKEYQYRWLKKKRQQDKQPQKICPCCGQVIDK